jgi:zinc transporter 1/2/3
MACWGIPLMNKNFSQNKTVLSRANVYAGGIFLMLSFGHLIPHSLEMFHSAGMESSTILKFTLAGLLAIFFLEKIAFDSHSILHGQSHSAECSIDCDNSHSHTIHDHSHSHFHEIRDKNRVINVLKSSLSDRGNRGTLSTRSALLLLLAMSLHR